MLKRFASLPKKPENIEITESDRSLLQTNIIDPFKMAFDIYNQKLDVNTLLYKQEKVRQEDNSVNNTIGKFHQNLLGEYGD